MLGVTLWNPIGSCRNALGRPSEVGLDLPAWVNALGSPSGVGLDPPPCVDALGSPTVGPMARAGVVLLCRVWTSEPSVVLLCNLFAAAG